MRHAIALLAGAVAFAAAIASVPTALSGAPLYPPALYRFMPPLPPVEFDRPYTGRLQWNMQGPAQIQRLCQNRGKEWFTHACAFPSGDSCVIVFPRKRPGMSAVYLERLRRHELGHCNGWPGDHPGARE